jgi:hypothetical protein
VAAGFESDTNKMSVEKTSVFSFLRPAASIHNDVKIGTDAQIRLDDDGQVGIFSVI